MTERRLAAILSADVAGYSRLMAEDEDETVRRIGAYRTEITNLVGEHRGRVVDFTGDNFLAEFPTATDAVEAASEIQRVIKARNAAVPAGRAMEFRIGIHLGEVRVEGERLYGDGVNIASRLEGLAEPGGACISAQVLDHVRRKLELDFDDLGKQTVKNIPDPVHAYRLNERPTDTPGKQRAPRIRLAVVLSVAAAFGAIAIAAVVYQTVSERSAAPAGPLITSIAVLPFDDMSPENDQSWLADGIAEELIESLSRIEELKVISRNSTVAMRGKDVRVVGDQLGVGSVVEGSVRRSGDQLRVTAQLIRVEDGSHLWSARYDRSLDDVLEVQQAIAREVAEAVRSELGVRDELFRGLSRQRYVPRDVRSWELLRKGVALSSFSGFSEGELRKAEQHFLKALEIDPEYPAALSSLGWNHFYLWYFGFDRNEGRVERAKAAQEGALELDPTNDGAHEYLALQSHFEADYEAAESRLRGALEANPEASGLRARYAEVLASAGRLDAALLQAQRSAELDPLFGHRHQTLAGIHLLMGSYDEAMKSALRARRLVPGEPRTVELLATAYHLNGMDEEAVGAWIEYLPASAEQPIRRAFAEGGWERANRAIIEVLAGQSEDACFATSPGTGAALYAASGDADAMFRCIDQTVSLFGDWDLALKRKPVWDPYRGDPRFVALLRQMNLEEE